MREQKGLGCAWSDLRGHIKEKLEHNVTGASLRDSIDRRMGRLW
jgi:hypothetical protein